MPLLTPEQIKLLEKATSLGILSPTKHQEALDRNAAERRLRDDLAVAQAAEPVKPRYTAEVRASELGVQIALRELEIANSESAGPHRALRIERLKRNLATFQKQLEQLKATHGIESLDRKPPTDDHVPIRHEIPVPAQVALDLLAELNAIQGGLLFVAAPVALTAASSLSNVDAELCLGWNDVAFKASSDSEVTAWTKLSELDTYRQCQILSARCAELVMQAYYAKLGFEVEDVSVRQLDGTTDEWKTYDLRVGERLVDVKNARKSLHGEGNYVEHCVPRFKQLRATGENIVIAGVLSDYLKVPDI